MSKKDRDVIDSFIATGSAEITARETHTNRGYVLDILKQPGVAEYITERLKHAAHKVELTEEKILSKLNMVIDSDGSTKFDPSFLRALEVASKILKLISPNSINIAQVAGANPFANKSDAELDQEIMRRMSSNIQPAKPED